MIVKSSFSSLSVRKFSKYFKSFASCFVGASNSVIFISAINKSNITAFLKLALLHSLSIQESKRFIFKQSKRWWIWWKILRLSFSFYFKYFKIKVIGLSWTLKIIMMISLNVNDVWRFIVKTSEFRFKLFSLRSSSS